MDVRDRCEQPRPEMWLHRDAVPFRTRAVERDFFALGNGPTKLQ